MPRNTEKDIQEEAERRRRILEAGFKLFSEYGIENVSMNAVAEVACVGPTTLFKYYRTKEKLLVSISGMVWSRVCEENLGPDGIEACAGMSAYEMTRRYTECIIRLYQQRPELLRFSGDYKTFICRRQTAPEELKEHLEPLALINAFFQAAYQRAAEDRTIRTDIPADLMFTTVVIGMLGVAERYAQGIVWARRDDEDHTRELKLMQEMLLNWCAGPSSRP